MPRINHVALKVTDLEKATRFYENVYGFRQVGTGRSRGHMSRHMTDGYIDSALMVYDSEDDAEAKMVGPGPAIHHFGVEVEDHEGFAEKVVANGGTILSKPGEIPIKYRAPDGTVAEIVPRGATKDAGAQRRRVALAPPVTVLGGDVLGFRHRQLLGMDDRLVGGSAGGAKIGKLGLGAFALQHIGCRHRLAAFLVGDGALDDRPMHPPGPAVLGLVGDILEPSIDRRFERIELLLDPSRRRVAAAAALAVPRAARTSAARTAVVAIAAFSAGWAAAVPIARSTTWPTILPLAKSLGLTVARCFLAGTAARPASARRPLAIPPRVGG